MKRLTRIFAAMLAVVLVLTLAPNTGQSAEAAYSPPYTVVKVGLNSPLRSTRPAIPRVTLTNSGGFNIGTYGSDRNFAASTSTSSTTVTVAAEGGTVKVTDASGKVIASGRSAQAVAPKSDTATAYNLHSTSYGNSCSYYGGFEFICSGSVMTAVNYVDIEQYLMGVVPDEMPASWPTEALKAQALCARTYVAYHFNAYSTYGFDVCNTTSSQVYNGVFSNSQYASKIKAVCQETAGQYIVYNGKPIDAVFHAASGGATENSENVWTNAVSYLRGVSDSYETTPGGYQFSGVFTADTIYNKIKAKDSSLGNSLRDIASISCSYTDLRNIYSVTLKDSQGATKTYSKENARIYVLGAFTTTTSQRFTITQGGSLSSMAADLQEQEILEQEEPQDIPDAGVTEEITPAEILENAQGDSGEVAQNDEDLNADLAGEGMSTQTIDLFSGQTYTISSRGAGHNVGLSQYGAKGMAEANYSYKQIVAHYYTGVQISTMPFSDVAASYWGYSAIEYVYEKGLFNGISLTTFAPDSPMIRGQVVTVLGRLSGVDPAQYSGGNGGFTDVNVNEYYAPYVQWGAGIGLINGYGDGKFGPEDSVTREQMCVIIKRYAELVGKTLPQINAAQSFNDNAAISDWAASAVEALQRAGIIYGMGNNTFSPKEICTRAQVAAILQRYMET